MKFFETPWGSLVRLASWSSIFQKRQKMFGKITDNIEAKFDEKTTNQQASKLDKLCVTRWTSRTECFSKIKENYQTLLQLMRYSLEEKLDFEIKSRIVVCKTVGVFLLLL